MPAGMEIPKTLVLNLSGTLVHTDFVFGKGAEIVKRPGLTKFLKHLQGNFEIVVFSDDDTMFTFNIVEKLDPTQQIFSGRFGRESMIYSNSSYYKDLKYLNRDLKRVVVIEKNPETLRE